MTVYDLYMMCDNIFKSTHVEVYLMNENIKKLIYVGTFSKLLNSEYNRKKIWHFVMEDDFIQIALKGVD